MNSYASGNLQSSIFNHQWLWAALGLILLAVSSAGILHGVRAGLAHVLYFQAKYGSARDDADRVLRLAERAHGLYPCNYNLCILAADAAYAASSVRDRDESARRRALAERWCGTGLKLNFHQRQLRRLKTRLLASESLQEAVRYWEDYVEWQFWDPYNHAVLVELYGRAGDFEKARRSLNWVVGSDRYEEALGAFQEAWSREQRLTEPSGTPP